MYDPDSRGFEMKLAGIEIVGESVSGFGTAISLPELGIALDCGVITPATMACQHVLITHAHMDHLHCAVRHMYLRDMTGSPHKSIFYVFVHYTPIRHSHDAMLLQRMIEICCTILDLKRNGKETICHKILFIRTRQMIK